MTNNQKLKDKYIYICKKYEQLVKDYEGLRKYAEKLQDVVNEWKEAEDERDNP
jgi:hypothetical protein